MEEYEIQMDSILHLVLRLRGGMKLFFKSAQSKLATVDVDPNMTVLQFKRQVTELEGIPVNLQRLMYLGKQLVD